MNPIKSSFVSIIIPVYNDTERLKICLNALEQQTYPSTMYEVVVVDNDSQEDIGSVTNQYKQAALYTEFQTGSYAARNKGISVSQGDILAFTDSDCIPASDWIENGVARLQKEPKCGLIAGKVSMFFKDPKRLTATEVYEKINAFDQQDNAKRKKFGVTANLFTLRSVLEKVGFFNSELKSGGDLEWGNRVYAGGYTLLYADDVCVLHPARHSLSELYKKRVRVIGGLKKIEQNTSYGFYETVVELKKICMHTIRLAKRFLYNRPPSEKFETTRQKLQYLLVHPYVRIITVAEKVRLQLGGEARR